MALGQSRIKGTVIPAKAGTALPGTQAGGGEKAGPVTGQ